MCHILFVFWRIPFPRILKILQYYFLAQVAPLSWAEWTVVLYLSFPVSIRYLQNLCCQEVYWYCIFACVSSLVNLRNILLSLHIIHTFFLLKKKKKSSSRTNHLIIIPLLVTATTFYLWIVFFETWYLKLKSQMNMIWIWRILVWSDYEWNKMARGLLVILRGLSFYVVTLQPSVGYYVMFDWLIYWWN